MDQRAPRMHCCSFTSLAWWLWLSRAHDAASSFSVYNSLLSCFGSSLLLLKRQNCLFVSHVGYSQVDTCTCHRDCPKLLWWTEIDGSRCFTARVPSMLLSPLLVTVSFYLTFSLLWSVCSKSTYTFPEMYQCLWEQTHMRLCCFSFFLPFFLSSLPWRLLTGMKRRAVGRCGNRQVCL